MKKIRNSLISLLVALAMLSCVSIVAYAESKYDVYLRITFPNGQTDEYPAYNRRYEANGKSFYVYTDEFPVTLKLYNVNGSYVTRTVNPYGQYIIDVQRDGLWDQWFGHMLNGYAKVEVKSAEKKRQEDKAKAEAAAKKKAVEDRNAKFKQALENAGMEYDVLRNWYFEHDILEFINGQWDGDTKEDNHWGTRYIIGRKYYISRIIIALNGVAYEEKYECNLDYSGSLESNSYGMNNTLVYSKKDNIVYCWHFFECLGKWQIPKGETITSVLDTYIENIQYGTCRTKDADGNEHMYVLNPEGKIYKVK